MPDAPRTESVGGRGRSGAGGRRYGGLTADQRHADRMARLLEVGHELFADRGFAKTGVRELCRAAKIGERAFYDTVGSREALLREVYLQATDAVIADIAVALQTAPEDFVGRAHAGLDAFFGAITRDPRRGRLIYVESLGRGAEIEEARREGLSRFVALVTLGLRPYLPEPGPSPVALDAALSAIILGIGELAYRLAEGEAGFTAEQATAQLTGGLAAAAVAFGLQP